MTAFDRAWSLLKQGVFRNKKTGETVELVGYDLIPFSAPKNVPDHRTGTHQVVIIQRENGKRVRWLQSYLDSEYDYVGEI